MRGLPFSSKRSIIIHKHISVVSSVLSDFSQWRAWSPWLCLEPECSFNVEGVGGELGHKQVWAGERIGAGSIVLVSKLPRAFTYELETITPWKSNSRVTVQLKGHGGETTVDWQIKGYLPFSMMILA